MTDACAREMSPAANAAATNGNFSSLRPRSTYANAAPRVIKHASRNAAEGLK